MDSGDKLTSRSTGNKEGTRETCPSENGDGLTGCDSIACWSKTLEHDILSFPATASTRWCRENDDENCESFVMLLIETFAARVQRARSNLCEKHRNKGAIFSCITLRNVCLPELWHFLQLDQAEVAAMRMQLQVHFPQKG